VKPEQLRGSACQQIFKGKRQCSLNSKNVFSKTVVQE